MMVKESAEVHTKPKEENRKTFYVMDAKYQMDHSRSCNKRGRLVRQEKFARQIQKVAEAVGPFPLIPWMFL